MNLLKLLVIIMKKYKGFSMETAVDTLMGVYNEHKLVEIEDENKKMK